MLQRLDRASAAFRTLAFRHYVLAQKVVGSNSIGSAGKTFEQMQASFLRHPHGESNAAKHRMHEYTSFKYSNFVGLGTQAVVDDAKATAMGSSLTSLDDIGFENVSYDDGDSDLRSPSEAILLELGRSIAEMDMESLLDLFDTDNCRIEHPPGTLVSFGHHIDACSPSAPRWPDISLNLFAYMWPLSFSSFVRSAPSIAIPRAQNQGVLPKFAEEASRHPFVSHPGENRNRCYRCLGCGPF